MVLPFGSQLKIYLTIFLIIIISTWCCIAYFFITFDQKNPIIPAIPPFPKNSTLLVGTDDPIVIEQINPEQENSEVSNKVRLPGLTDDGLYDFRFKIHCAAEDVKNNVIFVQLVMFSIKNSIRTQLKHSPDEMIFGDNVGDFSVTINTEGEDVVIVMDNPNKLKVRWASSYTLFYTPFPTNE